MTKDELIVRLTYELTYLKKQIDQIQLLTDCSGSTADEWSQTNTLRKISDLCSSSFMNEDDDNILAD